MVYYEQLNVAFPKEKGDISMKKLMDIGNSYLSRCKWQDMALLKLCLCAIGIIVGLSVPAKHRKCFLIGAGMVFIATYIPLMMKFIPVLKENGCCCGKTTE